MPRVLVLIRHDGHIEVRGDKSVDAAIVEEVRLEHATAATMLWAEAILEEETPVQYRPLLEPGFLRAHYQPLGKNVRERAAAAAYEVFFEELGHAHTP